MPRGVFDRNTEAFRASRARVAEKLRGRTAETDPGVARMAEKLRAYPYEGSRVDEYNRKREACFERAGSRSCAHCGMTQEEHLEKYSYMRLGKLVKSGLVFHHLDPATKLFDISWALCMTRKIWLEQLLQEVDKCQLLCRSCHVKLHRAIKRQLKLLIDQEIRRLETILN